MLTADETQIILSGWNQAMKDAKGLGLDIFLTLFEMFPQHQELFRDFKGKSRAELEKMPKLRAHGLRVVNTLDGAIQSLDDMESLDVVFTRRLGAAYTDNKAVWMKLLEGVIPVIQRGM
uniref:GLOBIN domain-containing protein n=1 Tax=Macrostomum lignano TaxID=282301 RepID=A0A1I8I8W0_9PLAT